MKKLKFTSASFDGNPGKNIGDDTCADVVRLGVKKMPPNKRFPEGIPVKDNISNSPWGWYIA